MERTRYNNSVKAHQPEIVLQYSWNCLPQKTKLYTIYGDEVIVLFPGRWNFEEGPDFKSARISIDDRVVVGDIEIHQTSSDWGHHGHSNDERYSNVILHIVLNLGKGDSPDIPTIVIPDKFIQEMPPDDGDDEIQRYPYGYCASRFSGLADNTLSTYFGKIGEKRFFERTVKITQDILKNGVEPVFLKYLFDSCGYKKNRSQFLELFSRLLEYGLDSLTVKEAIAVLWGDSGLLPDPVKSDLDHEMQSFIEENWSVWWKLRKDAKEKINWHLSGVRPLNNPCRRLAAISVLISRFGANLFAAILDEFNNTSESDSWKTFKKLLLCRDDLWDHYSNPYNKLNRRAAVLGEMRALDMMTNVILPFIYAYADIHSFKEIRNKALLAWKNLPACQQNIILKISSHRWLIPHKRAMTVFNSAATQQGAIFVHRKFCESSQMDCAKCPVFKELTQKTPE